MFFVRLIKWTAFVLLLLLVAAGSYLHFADLDLLKPGIEAAFEQATGRRLALDGPVDIDLLPLPALVVEGVSVSNADWGSEPVMATIGHVSARVRLSSLFYGPIRIGTLRLEGVDLLLESDEAGNENWTLGKDDEPLPEPRTKPKGPAAGRTVLVESAEFHEILVRFKEKGGDPLRFHLASLELDSEEGEKAHVEAEARIDGTPLRLSGDVGVESGEKTPEGIVIDLAGGFGSVDVEVRGTLGDPAKGAGIDLNLLAASDEVAGVLEGLAVDLPLTGKLRVEAAVTNADPGIRTVIEARAGELSASLEATRHVGALSFSATLPALDKAGAALGTPPLPAGDLAIEGRVATSREGYLLEGVKARAAGAEVDVVGRIARTVDAATLSIKARGPSLAVLSPDLPPLAFDAAAQVELAPGRLALKGIKAKVGESDLAGSLDVTTGKRPAVNGRLTSRQLDLTPFADKEPEASGEVEQPRTEEGSKSGSKLSKLDPAEEQRKPGDAYVFKETPLPLEPLRNATLNIETEVGRLVYHNTVLLDLATTVRLKDGTLAFRQRGRGPEGGKGAIDVTLAAASDPAHLDVDVNLRDMRLNIFSGEGAEPSSVPPVSITLDLDANGNSPRELASGVNGRVLVTQGKGQIRNNQIERFSGDVLAQLFEALNPFAKKEEFTKLDCTVVALDITDGKAQIPGLYLQGKRVKIVGGGSIDFKKELLNVEFNTKPRKGIGVSADMFVTPFVKMVGTLAEPRIGLDQKGVILAGATVATGGIALLAKAAFDRLTGGIDACDELLEKVGDHPPLPE